MAAEAHKRFLIVTGKGGVGKTTVCAAHALALAQQGKRVLIAMCNAKERLSAMLGSDLIGTEVIQAAPNVWAVNMTPDVALEEYGMLALKSKTVYSLLFDNRYVRVFFRAVPGIHEWSMLGKAWWHATEKLPDGRDRFDVVILDAPATGHGLDMLRVPKVIVEVVPPGLLRRDADAAWAMFRDPEQTGVVLVTLPEEMPTTETVELAAALTGELGMTIDKVVVNCVLPPLFSREERATLEGLAEVEPVDAGASALVAARLRAVREHVQAASLARLALQLPVRTAFLPLLFQDAATPQAIRELAKRL